ncbi:hypothetical protein K458DRAFT_468432 [Lentithecium fluviatile CBS 122367]|uniref:Extracellular membrane protein CFEM domain-containing protein n=1 Tax=Lentithecium fluviatile CBS 122367 TaxID=1168545 RepID=A0A6G1IFH1_9PLEO|nr:hypothetical protein K458DRAFT_468432 [Lentithecium fluviatile CBS 122367]
MYFWILSVLGWLGFFASLCGAQTSPLPTSTAATAATGNLPPTCGVERCLPSNMEGRFYGCEVSNFACISFMQGLQGACAFHGNPITSLPSEIATPSTSFVTTPSGSVANTTTTPPRVSTTPTTTNPSSGPRKSENKDLSSGAKVGIGTSAAAAALLLAGGLTVWIRRRRNKEPGETQSTEPPDLTHFEIEKWGMRGGDPPELEGEKGGMERSVVPFELEGDGGQGGAVSELESNNLTELEGDMRMGEGGKWTYRPGGGSVGLLELEGGYGRF